MAIRYGDRSRVSSRVGEWLNGKDAPWWNNINQSFADFINLVNGQNVTADATPHVKGAWTELFASTATDSDFQHFIISCSTSTVNTATLIDFAVGASGSEVPIVENIAIGGIQGIPLPLVVRIPAGSRISARVQSLVSSQIANVRGSIFNTGFFSSSSAFLDVLGTSTTTSLGTNITDSYSEIVASLSHSYAGFIVIPSVNAAVVNAGSQIVSVAVGGSGSEVDVLTFNVLYTASEGVQVRLGQYTFMKGPFTAGARISAKTSSSVNNGSKSLCLIGIPFI